MDESGVWWISTTRWWRRRRPFSRPGRPSFRELEEEGFPGRTCRRVHYEEVDPELLSPFGMGPFRMEPSFRETYLRLCKQGGRTPDPEVADACAALGRDFLGNPGSWTGAWRPWRRWRGLFPTVDLFPGGPADYQMGESGMPALPGILPKSRIRITHRKTPESFREALDHFGILDPARATMIGNSLRSDINPALSVRVRGHSGGALRNVALRQGAAGLRGLPSFPNLSRRRWILLMKP